MFIRLQRNTDAQAIVVNVLEIIKAAAAERGTTRIWIRGGGCEVVLESIEEVGRLIGAAGTPPADVLARLAKLEQWIERREDYESEQREKD